jgi:DNA-binding winged helix-turn-helix (wHTH) protein
MSIPRVALSHASLFVSAQHLPAPVAAGRRSRSFRFGSFLLQPERQRLLKLEAPVRIGGRALDLLTLLVERAGELLTKEELLSGVWPDTFVEEGNLKVHIAGLRRVLGECPTDRRFIATVVGRGYRFIAPVDTFWSPLGSHAYDVPAGRNDQTSHPVGSAQIAADGAAAVRR